MAPLFSKLNRPSAASTKASSPCTRPSSATCSRCPNQKMRKKIEGCPVVVLSGDTTQDWTHLLGAMYPNHARGSYSPWQKYDFALFQEHALCRLKTELPTTLVKWNEDGGKPGLHIKYENGMLFDMVALAREFGLLSVLPILYYRVLTELGGANVYRNVEIKLAPADRLACLLGYFKLLDIQANATLGWVDLGDVPADFDCCLNFDKCNEGVKKIRDLLDVSIRPNVTSLGWWDSGWDEHLCSECLEAARCSFDIGKMKSVFGLPAWPELLKSFDLA
ncbi:hypothetical protein B0H10DRAFT_2020142 [Mycena sp. CBHHK59/15]|nr:hypothetical protein B0H10DRAFT_2020142 [Mycena sp. CBHHK59/15]